MNRYGFVVLAGVLLAGAALAHSGVQNAAVKARMDAMSLIGAQMKTLGQMRKGALAFERDTARAAAAAIADHAAATPDLFRAPEDDPKSEAKPDIWVNFADFAAKAEAMQDVATGLSRSIEAAEDLGPAMTALGGTCKACHATYRE